MQVERGAAVNKDQRGEEKGQPVIAHPEKCCPEKRSCIEHEELHGQTRQPENSDNRADRSCEGSTGRECIRVEDCDSAEGDDHQDNEPAVDPEEPAQEW